MVTITRLDTATKAPGASVSEKLELGNSGILRAGTLRWLRAIGWMIALLVILVGILSLQSVVKSVDPNPSVVLTMAFICTFLAYFAYARLVRWAEHRKPREISLRFAVIEIAIGCLIGAAAVATVMGILWAAGAYEIARGKWTDWLHDIRETLGTGLLEELLARLVIFRLLARAFRIWPALILSAAAFGAGHLGNSHATVFTAFAITVEAGLMLAAFYVLTERIWVSVGAHAGWNLALGGIFGARVSGFESNGSLLQSRPIAGTSAFFSGGDFGPEGSIPAIIVGLALFVAVMLVRKNRLRHAES